MNIDLILNAYNVPSGGGAKLLKGLLRAKSFDKFKTNLFLDYRFPFSGNATIVKNTILSRLRAEWIIYKKGKTADRLLCFGNLPPIFPSRAKTFLFVQNKYLITDHPIHEFSALARIRIRLERLWISLFSRHVDFYVVQTEHMKCALCEHLKVNGSKIHVLPFDTETLVKSDKKNEIKKNTDFLYVASGEPHKNHKKLLEAWEKLAHIKSGLKLTLTIDQGKFPSIQGVNYVGKLDAEGLEHLYRKHDFLLFPSLLESFGLPIIEAVHRGMNVAASDLDFVHELIVPSATFNPYSEDDIVNAIIKLTEGHFEPTHFQKEFQLLEPEELIQFVMNR